MHWNFRIMEERYNDEPNYTVVEVYYDDNNKLDGYCNATLTSFESLEDLKGDLELITKALEAPVVYPHEFTDDYKQAKK